MESKEIQNIIQKYPIITGWIQNLPDELLSRCRLVFYSRGKHLYHRDEEVKKVYIVCKGDVLITNSDVNGNEMGVVVVPQGTSVGEMEAMLEIPNLVYSAKALTDCVLLEIPISDFKKWIEKDHGVCQRLAMELARKLYSSSASTVNYQSLPAQTRLKLFLIDCGTGKVMETRERLAEICGVSMRTVNRAVVSLRREHFLEVEKGKIILRDEHIKRLTESIIEEI